MVDASWSLDSSSGELLIRTATAGPAAKMGHRLTIRMRSWQASVTWRGQEPVAAGLTVEVDSLEVLRGDGGVTPLTAPEKALARSNALKCLDARKFPEIRFATERIAKTDDGYRLVGALQIHGQQRPQTVDLTVKGGDEATSGTVAEWAISARVPLIQSDFGVKPYSLMMGALKVADEVVVEFAGRHPQ